MKYVHDFVKYSLLFFLLFEAMFLLAFFSQFGFSLKSMSREIAAVNILKTVSATLIAIGCGIYFSSFVIFHNRNMKLAFFISVVFGLIAVKGIGGNYIFAHFFRSSLISNVILIVIAFAVSMTLIVASIVSQMHQNAVYNQTTPTAADSDSTDSSLFM